MNAQENKIKEKPISLDARRHFNTESNTSHKAIIFDSGTLISFAMNGMFEELRELKKVFDGKFLITQEVKQEIINKPMNIKRFELEALRLNQLLEEKVLELPVSIGIKDSDITKKTNEFMQVANSLFYMKGKEVKILGLGESSCLGLSVLLNEKRIKNVLAIDERTIRVLLEKPENLTSLLQRKMNASIKIKSSNYKIFKGFKVIRSTELVYVLYKKGLSKLKGPNVLDALLYAMKFKGCAISSEEIEEIKKIG
ncbi:MAG: hypothetical protein KJ949_01780 [Nanoarchaeota archaeon]|nr:hypothetical protein [Nanoarchaeota archaeon]